MADQQVKVCRECRGQIPAAATRCMHCGQSQSKTTNPIVILVCIAVIAGGALVILNAAGMWAGM